MGLEFEGLAADLDGESYPLSKDDLLSSYGDREIEHAGGSVTLAEILDPLDDRTFDGPDEVHQSVLNMVGDGAVGRKGYSDRATNDTNAEYDQQSF